MKTQQKGWCDTIFQNKQIWTAAILFEIVETC